MSEFDALLSEIDNLKAKIELAINPPPVVEDDPPLTVPEGWGEVSNDLRIARRQYADAANIAANYIGIADAIVGDWKTVIIKPNMVDALFISAHMVIKRILIDMDEQGQLTNRTLGAIRSYVAALETLDEPIAQFMGWAKEKFANDPSAATMRDALAASGIEWPFNPVAPSQTAD